MLKRERLLDLAALGVVVAFAAVSCVGLDRFPAAQLDEVWQAAPGYDFFETGRFATPIFAGFFGMERHYYGFMPLSPLFLGASLRLFGLSLGALRLVPLLMACGVLALTYLLGRRLFSAAHGLLAIAMLACWPIAFRLPYLTTGIPLADLARIGRYDIPVPVFGLLALLVVAPREDGDMASVRSARFFWAGALAGLATLCHAYGAAWLAVILVPFGIRNLSVCARRAGAAVLGFLLALAPWLVFVASGWQDFVDQNRNYSPRFALSRVDFFTSNVLREIERYSFVGSAMRRGGVTAWIFALSVLAGSLVLASGARRRPMPRAACFLLGPLLVLAGSFALLLEQKNRMYLATIWPFLALIASVGLLAVVRRLPKGLSFALPLMVAVTCVEGALAYRRLVIEGRAATPYAALVKRLHAAVPLGSRVLAVPLTWMDPVPRTADFRALNVPIYLASASFVRHPVPFGTAADAVGADVLIVDRTVSGFLQESRDPKHPFHALGEQMRAWIESRREGLLADFEDPTYGRFEVWRLRRAP
ncbi:MAG: hypothetical protein ABIT01_08855 [Thermoanaerobaculia bacterium]